MYPNYDFFYYFEQQRKIKQTKLKYFFLLVFGLMFYKMIVKIPQFVKMEALWNRLMASVAVSVWMDWRDQIVQSWILVLVCVIFSYIAYI